MFKCLTFKNKLQNFFIQNGDTILYSQQEHIVSAFPHLCQHVVCSGILNLGHSNECVTIYGWGVVFPS